MDNKNGAATNPIYKKLLIAALVFYVIGTCIIQTDLYYKIGTMEHRLCHMLEMDAGSCNMGAAAQK